MLLGALANTANASDLVLNSEKTQQPEPVSRDGAYFNNHSNTFATSG